MASACQQQQQYTHRSSNSISEFDGAAVSHGNSAAAGEGMNEMANGSMRGSTPIVSPTSAAAAGTIYSLLQFPENQPGRNSYDTAVAARKKRAAFLCSPDEREPPKCSRSGRILTEPEVLGEKHEAEFRQLVPAISQALSRLIKPVTSATYDRANYGIYETSSPPSLQLEDYIHRIAEYTYVSPSTLLSAVILLDRFLMRHPDVCFTQLNMYKLFFVATRVSSKVIDLRALNNKHFASVGGISNKHLNDLESKFLTDLHFGILVSPADFARYAKKILPSTFAGGGANSL